MKPSITQLAVREVSKALHASVKADGFRRRSPHLFRERGALIDVVNFQCSAWGSATRGAFTINLAISNRTLYTAFTGNLYPSNPGTALWPIQERIGRLVGSYDTWWEVDEAASPASLAEAIIREYQGPMLSWFSDYVDVDAMIYRLDAVRKYGDVPGVYETQAPLFAAVLCHSIGNLDESRKRMLKCIKAHESTPFGTTVRTVAGRLGIDVA